MWKLIRRTFRVNKMTHQINHSYVSKFDRNNLICSRYLHLGVVDRVEEVDYQLWLCHWRVDILCWEEEFLLHRLWCYPLRARVYPKVVRASGRPQGKIRRASAPGYPWAWNHLWLCRTSFSASCLRSWGSSSPKDFPLPKQWEQKLKKRKEICQKEVR